MRLTLPSGDMLIRDRSQWLRCGFDATTLLDGMAALAPLEGADVGSDDPTPFGGGFAGLSFDRHCRVFHALPEQGGLEVALWGKQTPLGVHQDPPQPYVIHADPAASGDFGGDPSLPIRPTALACDDADYLYIADPDTPAIWLIDIWQHDVARRIDLPAQPRDLAYRDGQVYALLDTPAWLRLTPCDPPQTLPWPSDLAGADRLDLIDAGRAFVLLDAGTATAELVCLQNTTIRLSLPFCTDFVIGELDNEAGPLFVFARRPGEDFLRRRFEGRQFGAMTGLQAPGYDGRGIALSPDGRVAYWTARGLRLAAPARTRYQENGAVFGYALDSGVDQNAWGLLTLEACIPDGTQIRVFCLTRDDLDYGDALPRTPPAGESPSEIALPETTPLPSALAWAYREGDGQILYRDESPRPLAPPDADGFARYTAPVIAAPGRFLWLVFFLTGTRSKTPRLRSARAAYPGHDLLKSVPRTLWREPQAKSFLTRYLASIAQELRNWGDISEQRQILLNPCAAPAAALDWLASLLGLAMDPCWSESSRRRFIRECAALFRERGTPRSLKRMVEILSGGQVILIERFRLRGGGVAGNPQATSANAVLGGGFRVGGSLAGTPTPAIAAETPQDFDAYAHRFTLMIVANLSEEQLGCVRRLVETHKPAHTAYDVCTVAGGIRVGLGLHVGLASVIGGGSGFDRLTVGDAVLGRGYLLGRPDLSRSAAAVCGSETRACEPGATS